MTPTTHVHRDLDTLVSKSSNHHDLEHDEKSVVVPLFKAPFIHCLAQMVGGVFAAQDTEQDTWQEDGI